MEEEINNEEGQNREIESSFYTQDQNQPIPPANVIAYNELRSCADLYRLHETGKLEIQPDFQREIVWNLDEQTRFIDSLVKQLPIPSMCFSFDYKTKDWKVIDGLQRMYTIISFLGKDKWQLASIKDIFPLLSGAVNTDLRNGNSDQRDVYLSVQNLTIPVTVIRCDYNDNSHMKYLFTIFNRLNSGGTRLNNQEIRNCIFSGNFNTMLKDFDEHDENWKSIRGRIWGTLNRFKSVEILLRILALTQNLDNYDGNLAGFLNDQMMKFTNLDSQALKEYRLNLEYLTYIAKYVLDAYPERKKSLTFVEGILVGILKNISNINSQDKEDLKSWCASKAENFRALSSYAEGASYALSDEQKVKNRLKEAMRVFSE